MKRFFLSLFGILFLLIGLVLTGAGTFVAAAGGTQGSITNTAGTAAGNGNALLLNDFAIDTGGVDTSKVVEMTVGARALNGKPLFIGLGSTTDVINYLNEVPRDVVTGISSSQATVTAIPGTATPADPAVQGFWLASGQGASPSLVLPSATTGSTLVVMNQDGSPNVSIEMSVGVESPRVFYGAIALIVLGIILIILAIVFFRKSGKIKKAKKLAKQEQLAAAQQGQVPTQAPQAPQPGQAPQVAPPVTSAAPEQVPPVAPPAAPATPEQVPPAASAEPQAASEPPAESTGEEPPKTPGA